MVLFDVFSFFTAPYKTKNPTPMRAPAPGTKGFKIIAHIVPKSM
jgi:hypothetical protein